MKETLGNIKEEVMEIECLENDKREECECRNTVTGGFISLVCC